MQCLVTTNERRGGDRGDVVRAAHQGKEGKVAGVLGEIKRLIVSGGKSSLQSEEQVRGER